MLHFSDSREAFLDQYQEQEEIKNSENGDKSKTLQNSKKEKENIQKSENVAKAEVRKEKAVVE